MKVISITTSSVQYLKSVWCLWKYEINNVTQIASQYFKHLSNILFIGKMYVKNMFLHILNIFFNMFPKKVFSHI